jgi:hypothetical protein
LKDGLQTAKMSKSPTGCRRPGIICTAMKRRRVRKKCRMPGTKAGMVAGRKLQKLSAFSQATAAAGRENRSQLPPRLWCFEADISLPERLFLDRKLGYDSTNPHGSASGQAIIYCLQSVVFSTPPADITPSAISACLNREGKTSKRLIWKAADRQK